jgi:hypothetical protein
VNGELELFATALAEQWRRLENGLGSVSSALDRAADRIAAALDRTATPVPGPPSALAPAAAAVTAVTGAVRVVNDASAPVVVTVLGAPPQQQVPPGLVPASASVVAVAPAAVAGPPVAVESAPIRELETLASRLVESSTQIERVATVGATPAAAIVEAGASAQQTGFLAVSTLTTRTTQPTTPGPVPLAPATEGPLPTGPTVSLPPLPPLPPPPAPGTLPLPAAAPTVLVPPARTPAVAPPLTSSEPPADRILRAPETRPPATEAERGCVITLNGGISVEVTAQTIDMEHAPEVAREIAEDVLEEIERLIERDRFRRGLPTAVTA